MANRSNWRLHPSGRRVRLFKATADGPPLLQWDDSDGEITPATSGAQSENRSSTSYGSAGSSQTAARRPVEVPRRRSSAQTQQYISNVSEYDDRVPTPTPPSSQIVQDHLVHSLQGLRLAQTAEYPQDVIVETGQSGTSSGRQYRGQRGYQTRRLSISNTPLVGAQAGSISIQRPAEGPSQTLSGYGGSQQRPSHNSGIRGGHPPVREVRYGPSSYSGSGSGGAPGGAPGGGPGSGPGGASGGGPGGAPGGAPGGDPGGDSSGDDGDDGGEGGWGLRRSGWFKIGRVFAVEWHEPRGRNNDESLTTLTSTLPELSTRITKARRMVVVRAAHGASWCVPVHTYGNQGCEKRGVDPSTHAILYSERRTPWASATEYNRGLPSEAIAMNVAPGEILHIQSRINFDKVHTIDHNRLVRNIGCIPVNTRSFNRLVGRWQDTIRARAEDAREEQARINARRAEEARLAQEALEERARINARRATGNQSGRVRNNRSPRPRSRSPDDTDSRRHRGRRGRRS